MSESEPTTRRRFLGWTVRAAGVAGLGAGAAHLLWRSGKDKVFQIDPYLCVNCLRPRKKAAGEGGGEAEEEPRAEACDLCRTSCVLPLSAVKAVNDFTKCGYCMLCPAYFDVKSDTDAKGMPTGKVCPRDAIKRRVVGKEDPDDPNNNYYEYTIDEALCDGCGKCVLACREPSGNGSLRLAIRHDRCVECNDCAIGIVCEGIAIARVDRPGLVKDEGEAS
jgi:hypothetical protein